MRFLGNLGKSEESELVLELELSGWKGLEKEVVSVGKRLGKEGFSGANGLEKEEKVFWYVLGPMVGLEGRI